MNRDKQIEEMAEVLWEYSRTRDDDAIALGESLAEYLLEAGYRKSEDVAREIIEEIWENEHEGDFAILTRKRFAELKKKYIQSEDK